MRSRISRTGWRGRLGAALALIIAIAVVIVIVLGASSSSTPTASGNASNASGATTVQRRNLVETDTESGTLSYAKPQTVYNRLTGTITWLPNVGQVIKAGQTLYKVDGAPVTLLNGTTPAYRDLTPSDSDGPDVTQLNRDLVALGFNPDGITIDDQWQAATTAGVELFQESLGESPTGTLSLGQVVFLPGDQLVTTIDATLGGTGSGGSSTTDTSAIDPAPAAEFVSLTSTTPCTTGMTATTTTTAPTTTPCAPSTPGTGTTKHGAGSKAPTQKQTLAALIALLRADTAELNALKRSLATGGKPSSTGSSPKSSGSKSGAGSSGSGSSSSGDAGSSGSSGDSGGGSGGNATAILQTTSTQLVATVDLSASSQSEAVVGERVQVEMPNGGFVNGVISQVSPVAQSSSNSGNGNSGSGNSGGSGNGNGNGSSSSSTVPVTVALSGHVSGAGLDQASVSVNFAEAKAYNVLSVPVTALLATSGDTYAVQEAAAPHRLIPVTTGLFAAGFVQISGPGIYSGLQVTDSQG